MKCRSLTTVVGALALVCTGWWLVPASASGPTCTGGASASGPLITPSAGSLSAHCTAAEVGGQQNADVTVTYTRDQQGLRFETTAQVGVLTPNDVSDEHGGLSVRCFPDHDGVLARAACLVTDAAS